MTSSVDLIRDPEAWDRAVLANGGHFLQTWGWGEFKCQFGWSVARIAVTGDAGTALAQMLVRRKAGVSVGYIPRGPVPAQRDDSIKLWQAIGREAWRQLVLDQVRAGAEALSQGGLSRVPQRMSPPHSALTTVHSSHRYRKEAAWPIPRRPGPSSSTWPTTPA